MRKILTLSMVASAALMVAGCGGNKAANNVVVDNTAMDTTYDANAADMSMDTNMTMDTNMAGGNASSNTTRSNTSGNAAHTTTSTTTTHTTTSTSNSAAARPGNHH
jgi:hypothetical protein